MYGSCYKAFHADARLLCAYDLIALLRHGVIGLDDLQEFSDEFKMQVSRIDL